jgi:hypothetical protein
MGSQVSPSGFFFPTAPPLVDARVIKGSVIARAETRPGRASRLARFALALADAKLLRNRRTRLAPTDRYGACNREWRAS